MSSRKKWKIIGGRVGAFCLIVLPLMVSFQNCTGQPYGKVTLPSASTTSGTASTTQTSGTPSPSVTPAASSTPQPSSTPQASATPSSTPSPSPSLTPSPTPRTSPTPSPSPRPSATPSPSPSPTPIINAGLPGTPNPNTITSLRFLTLRVSFQDASIEAIPKCSTTNLKRYLYNNPDVGLDPLISMSLFVKQVSHGIAKVDKTASDMFSISVPFAKDGSYSTDQFFSAVSNASKAAGFDPGLYDHTLMFFPANKVFGNSDYGGWLPYIGSGAALGESCDNLNIINHEIGHSLGLGHANGVWAKDPFWSSARINGKSNGHIAALETDDSWDHATVMGATVNSNIVSYNGPHLEQLGWLLPSNILTAQGSGEFQVTALEQTTSAVQMIKIPSREHGYYYISLHQPRMGVDGVNNQQIPSYYFQGVTVNAASIGFTDDQGRLESDSFVLNRQLGVIRAGNSFDSPLENIKITLSSISADGSTANLHIDMPQQSTGTCTRRPPTFTPTDISKSGKVGDTLTYNLTVTNNDSAACSATLFNLWAGGVAPDNGLTGSFTSGAFLNPGQTKTVQLVLTSVGPVAKAGANLLVYLNMVDASLANHNASALAHYLVIAP